MPIIVSNSELGQYQTCEKKWWYGFAQGIRVTKSSSQALGYGVLGHEALEFFYKSLQAGDPYDTAVRAGMDIVNKHISKALAGQEFLDEELDVAQVVGQRFLEYTKQYRQDGWRVLAVEETFYSQLSDDITYAMTADLIVENTSGYYKGQIHVVDHKWCYNFWSQIEMDMHPQFPKYIDTLRENGYPIDKGILNMLRYRSNAVEVFRRMPIVPTETRIKNVRKEELKIANKVAKLIHAGVAASKEIVDPHRERRTCKECQYNLICKIELDGRDPTPTISAMFEPNPYGYSRGLTQEPRSD